MLFSYNKKLAIVLKYVFAEDTLSRRENNNGNNILCLNLIKLTFVSWNIT